MTVTKEIDTYWELRDMCWSGALQTLTEVERQGREQELMCLLEEVFAEGASEVEINDFLWFEVSDFLGLYSQEEDEE